MGMKRVSSLTDLDTKTHPKKYQNDGKRRPKQAYRLESEHNVYEPVSIINTPG